MSAPRMELTTWVLVGYVKLDINALRVRQLRFHATPDHTLVKLRWMIAKSVLKVSFFSKLATQRPISQRAKNDLKCKSIVVALVKCDFTIKITMVVLTIVLRLILLFHEISPKVFQNCLQTNISEII